VVPRGSIYRNSYRSFHRLLYGRAKISACPWCGEPGARVVWGAARLTRPTHPRNKRKPGEGGKESYMCSLPSLTLRRTTRTRSVHGEGAALDATATGPDRIGGHTDDVSTPLGSKSGGAVADRRAAPQAILFDPRNSRAYLIVQGVQGPRRLYIGRYNDRQAAHAAGAAVLLAGGDAEAAAEAQKSARCVIAGPVPMLSSHSTADGRRNLGVKINSTRLHLGSFPSESTARIALDTFFTVAEDHSLEVARQAAKRMSIEARFSSCDVPSVPDGSQDMVTACPGTASRPRAPSSSSTSRGPPVKAVTPPGMLPFVRSPRRLSSRSAGA